MRPLIIINPLLYRLKKNILARRYIEKLREELNADAVFAGYRGHAEKIAGDSAGYDIIIACGGDGTAAEVVNGMNLATQKLAIVPLGTGNSLARDLGIKTVKRAGDIIRKGHTASIDIINCEFKRNGREFSRYVISTSGIGFTAAVADFANRYLKITGPICYSFATCFKLFNQKVASATIEIDGVARKNIDFTNFLINNTKHSGNACIFPEARLDDSCFNVLYSLENAVGQYLWNVGVITKTYFYRAPAEKARSLRIMLKQPSLFMLDGEIFDSVSDMAFSITDKKLKVIT